MPDDTPAHDLVAEQQPARPGDDSDLTFGDVLEAERRAAVGCVVGTVKVVAADAAFAYLGAAAVA